MAWAPSPKARAGPIVFEAWNELCYQMSKNYRGKFRKYWKEKITLANLAEEIIFIVLVIFSILRIDLRRMPNSLSLPDEFRTWVIVWREASILNIIFSYNNMIFLSIKLWQSYNLAIMRKVEKLPRIFSEIETNKNQYFSSRIVSNKNLRSLFSLSQRSLMKIKKFIDYSDLCLFWHVSATNWNRSSQSEWVILDERMTNLKIKGKAYLVRFIFLFIKFFCTSIEHLSKWV